MLENLNKSTLLYSSPKDLLLKSFKKISLLPFVVIVSVLLISNLLITCSDSETAVTQYDGVYSGTYSGSDTGTWSATIIKGKISTGGGRSSTAGSFTISTGNVSSSGLFSATANIGTTFSGQISGSTVRGTWVNGSASGTFTGTK